MGTTMNGKAMGVLGLLTTLVVSGCGDSPLAPVEAPRATTVEISPGRDFLVSLGAEVEFTAQVQDQNGRVMSGVQLVWQSVIDGQVLEHKGEGRFLAVGEGNTVVTAHVAGIGSEESGRVIGAVPVNVVQVPVEAELTVPGTDLWSLGEQKQLQFQIVDVGGAPLERRVNVTWSTGDARVATVDAQGRVRAVGNGVVTITAHAEGFTRSVDLVVDATVPYTFCTTWAFDNGLGEIVDRESCMEREMTLRTPPEE